MNVPRSYGPAVQLQILPPLRSRTSHVYAGGLKAKNPFNSKAGVYIFQYLNVTPLIKAKITVRYIFTLAFNI